MCIFCLARDGKTQRSRLCADATGRCIRRCHEMGASCGCVRAHGHLCEECIAPICRYTDARTAGAFAKAPWDLINHLAATIPDALMADGAIAQCETQSADWRLQMSMYVHTRMHTCASSFRLMITTFECLSRERSGCRTFESATRSGRSSCP